MNSSRNKPISVLLIDDDEDDYIIIKRVFAQIPDLPFVLEWCSSFPEAQRLIDARCHDVYLIDYHLGEHTGIELLEYAQPRKRSEPFILLTGAGDKEVEKQSMKLAAADYLVKGTFKADLLSRTLYYALERKQIEEERLQQYIELNRTKDEFISVASHQLRTPATGVKQYVGMVLEGFVGEITDAQRTVLQKAFESNERQLQIVSDLLKVAQVDAGKVSLRPESVLLAPLITDVITEQTDVYQSRRQSVIFEKTDSSITAVIDKNKIRMVLENLLDNASKYSDPGTTVRVTLEAVREGIEIGIHDQGVGISPDDRDKLFEKFSRIHNPFSSHVDGTGLGLYWVKKVVDLHKGSITVNSEAGKGTTFMIYLPNTMANRMLGIPRTKNVQSEVHRRKELT